jgi:uncharacterized protein YjbI with pentapeptide repeats
VAPLEWILRWEPTAVEGQGFLGRSQLASGTIPRAGVWLNARRWRKCHDARVADTSHLELLRLGTGAWNDGRPSAPDLRGADLFESDLRGVDLHNADLRGADLRRVNLREANLAGADLRDAQLYRANLNRAGLQNADLTGADLMRAFLSNVDLTGAQLRGADLRRSTFVKCEMNRTDLDGALVHGISAWDLTGTPASQDDLVITREGDHEVTVDNLKIAQFIYLLLNNAEIRDVIDTVGKKGVLILGRFTERMTVLDGLRRRLRELGYVPMVFDFERPVARDLTETVSTLAGLSAFILADLTAPRSTPHEAQAVIPNYMVPFVPIIEAGESPYAMFQDLWSKHDWVMEPLVYESIDVLLPVLDREIVAPALELAQELEARKAGRMPIRTIGQSRPPR